MAHRTSTILSTLASTALAASLLGALAGCEESHPSTQDARVLRGIEIAPVQLNPRRGDLSLIGLGSYIVNAQGGCNDCHTCPSYAPGHDPFQGEPARVNAANYLAGGRAFGPIVAPSITPDAGGRPGGLTLEEFLQLMRTGHDPDEPGEILQVMPWPVYGQMTEGDLRAIYEYLRAIPRAEPGTCG